MKRFILLILLIFMVGCNLISSSDRASSYKASGTQGLVLSFLPNAPPDRMAADDSRIEVPISVEISNLGSYPVSEDNEFDRWMENDIIFLSGYDPNLFSNSNWRVNGESEEKPVALLANSELPGKSYFNVNGGFDLVEFSGTLDLSSLQVEKFSQDFLVTACYQYFTRASPVACIDQDVFAPTTGRKPCIAQDIQLSSQGAPIAITKIEQEVLQNSVQFKIFIKNAGSGDVVKLDSLSKCSPDVEEKIGLKDIDFVKVNSFKVSEIDITNLCKPLEEGYVRLFENEGFFTCTLPKDDQLESAYTTSMFIELAYGYRNSVSKHVEIINVLTG